MSSSAKPKKSRFGPPKAELQNLAAKLMANSTPLPSNFVPPPQNQYPLEDGSQPSRHVIPPMPSANANASPKLFVSSLPPDANSDDLRQAFEPFGAVLTAEVVKSRENPEYNRGFGFIQFYTKADSEKALSSAVHMHGQTLFVKISDKPSSGGRPADWDCMQCGAKGCFGSKPNCFKCGAPNPANPNATQQNGPGGFERRMGDWDCPACGAKGCFGSKPTCFKCGASRPSDGGYSGGRGNFGGRNDSYGGRNDGGYNSGGYGQQQRGGYGQDRGRGQDRGGYGQDRGGRYDGNRGGGYQDRNQGGYDRRDNGRRGGYDDRGGDRRRDRDYDRRY